MADLTVSNKLQVVFPENAEIYPAIAAVAMAIGKACYFNTSGNAALSDGSAAGTAHFDGLALEAAGAGFGISLLKRGIVAGFNLSGLAYGASVYLSDTDTGILADAAGTVSVAVGKVVPLSDADRTKVLFIGA
jgi:hypothetical protein